MPPEKPLQLAKTMRGSPSLFMSLMAWAVLKAESGNHTCPACWMICKRTCRRHNQETGHKLRSPTSLTLASESKLAGSAGMDSSTDLVSTATTPVGIPPNLPVEDKKHRLVRSTLAKVFFDSGSFSMQQKQVKGFTHCAETRNFIILHRLFSSDVTRLEMEGGRRKVG